MQFPKQFLLKRMDTATDLPLPARQTAMSAGLDLHANVNETVTIKKGERVLIPTGIKIALPFGYEAQIRPRSGLALKHGITLAGAPGTIDADYRGQIHALLINLGGEDFQINRGDRIAQMVVNKVEMIEFEVLEGTEELPDSQRGEGGYGSTGV